jgi:hypothetical protein
VLAKHVKDDKVLYRRHDVTRFIFDGLILASFRTAGLISDSRKQSSAQGLTQFVFKLPLLVTFIKDMAVGAEESIQTARV